MSTRVRRAAVSARGCSTSPALSSSGDQVQLWTFQSNAGARRFYERHGFVAVQTTDGDNEEQAPDIRYLWRRNAVVFRPAEASDLPAVCDLYRDVVLNHHASLEHEPPDLAYWEGRLAELLPHDRLLVAVDGSGEVVGFAESYTFRPRAGFDRTRERPCICRSRPADAASAPRSMRSSWLS